MVAGCGSKTIKLILFILNFTIWAAGIVLISIGSWVTAKQQDYTDLFAEDSILIVTGVTIGVGCFIFLVGFSGCCGALKESKALLTLYFAFLMIIIAGMITIATLAFVYDDKLEQSMYDGMTYTITNNYAITDAATESVDGIQESFDCCGAYNYTDYTTAAGLANTVAVPESCCISNVALCQSGTKGQPDYPEYIHAEGCVQASIDVIVDNYLIIGAVAFGILALLGIQSCMACALISAINKGEYA